MNSIAFEDRLNGQKTVCVDLVLNIMWELRKDHKIRMTIKNKSMEQYISLDLEDLPPEEEQTPYMKQVLKAKNDHRDALI